MKLFQTRPAYKYLLALGDWILINLAFGLSLRIRVLTFLEPPYIDVIDLSAMEVIPEVIFFAVFSWFWLWILQYNNLYKVRVFMSRANQQITLFKALLYSTLFLVVIQYLFKPYGQVHSRFVILLTFIISLILLSVWRLIIFRFLYSQMMKNRTFRSHVLIIGVDEQARKVAASLMSENHFGKQLVGFVDNTIPAGVRVFSTFLSLGDFSEIPRIVRDHFIREVIIAREALSHEEITGLINSCQKLNLSIQVTAPIYKVIPDRIDVEVFDDIALIPFSSPGLKKAYCAYKRVVDLFVAGLVLVIASPGFLVIALLIKLGSRGEVLFKQTRIGLNGTPFTFYKFRSMEIGADNNQHKDFVLDYMQNSETDENNVQKIETDTRVTKIGAFLRKYSLDELPQLLNVFRGEMSLVGPRPCLEWEWENYEQWQKRRMSIKPGCTGLWQVSGRSAVGFKDMVILDLYYVENASPWFDLQLMLKTIPVMILGRGGY